MKKQLIKYTALIALCASVGAASAQRGFVGAGFAFTTLPTINSTMQIGNTEYNGTSKSSIMALGLSYTRYTSVRRGYTLHVNPITTVKETFDPDDKVQKTQTVKNSGVSFGISMFGLIATDYQSKIEVHILNYFQLCTGAAFFTGADFVGVSARYRLNSKMKISADLLPFGLYSGGFGTIGRTLNLRFYFAP